MWRQLSETKTWEVDKKEKKATRNLKNDLQNREILSFLCYNQSKIKFWS